MAKILRHDDESQPDFQCSTGWILKLSRRTASESERNFRRYELNAGREHTIDCQEITIVNKGAGQPPHEYLIWTRTGELEGKMGVRSFKALKFGEDIWDPSHRFETSWLLSPWVLFGCRAAISLYAFVVTFFIIGWEASNQQGFTIHDVNKSFSYFTILCYWGICFYFAIAAIHTFSYAINGGTPLLNRFPRPFQALHYLFWSSITTYPFLVTIVYWGILFTPPFNSRFSLWSDISQHVLNSAFALFEIIFTRINPAPWIHILFLIIILACYCGLAYLTHYTKGYYVYSFLNPNPKELDAQGTNVGGVGQGAVVGYVFGIAVAVIILFSLMKGLAWTRKWVTEKKMGREGVFYRGRKMGQGEVELETVRMWEK
ncbi:hypothetical protein G7Y89_g5763 [Cudoniella acicularis]|uniref:Uncharacterized protein n=1 Tax=Cudoniella acicularis TaxID=354080 RepID=A0A8H4RLV4_9HELO|nr:hypothetical protein G7Y89_g5763 [Cudoniella acicularis]